MTDSDMEQPESGPGRGSPKCGARRRQGEGYCGKPAGWGTRSKTGRCSLHGGNTPSHRKTAEVERAKEAVNTFGLPREIGPAEALLEEVHRTAGVVAWLDVKVRTIAEEEMVFGVTEEHYKEATEFGGTDVKKQAAPNVWVELHHKERKHLVAVCKAALDSGIAERQVKLAETQGQQLVSVISETLTLLGHDLSDPKVLDVLRVVLSKAAGAVG